MPLLRVLLAIALAATTSAAMGKHHHSSGFDDTAGPYAPPAANVLAPAVGGVWEPSVDFQIQAIHAVHLPTDKIMIWGYDGGGGSIPVRFYDRATGTLTDDLIPKSAFCSGHAHLPDGRVIILGGKGGNGGGRYTIYDPFTQTFTVPELANARRYYPSLTSTPDGRVITFSGTGGGAKTPEIYDPDTDTWTRLGCPPGAGPSTPCRLASIRIHWYARTAFNANGVLFTIPATRDNYLFSLNLGTETWTAHHIGPYRDGKVRGGPAAYYAPGKLLKAGHDHNSRFKATAETVVIDFSDENNPTWRNVAPMAFARNRNNMTILADGTVLATGGIRGNVATGQDPHIYEAEVWDPATETWTTLNPMHDYRVYHSTAILMRDGTVLSAGGERKQKTAQIFHPPYLHWGPRPTITSAPTEVYYDEPFEVLTPDPGSISAVNLVKLGAVTHTYDQSQQIVRMAFTAGVDRLFVDGPEQGGYYAPPGYYMLFLISNQGVPSIAEYVKVEAEED